VEDSGFKKHFSRQGPVLPTIQASAEQKKSLVTAICVCTIIQLTCWRACLKTFNELDQKTLPRSRLAKLLLILEFLGGGPVRFNSATPERGLVSSRTREAATSDDVDANRVRRLAD